MLARLARGRGWLLPGVLTSCLKPCESVQAFCRACQLSQITNLLAQPFLLFVSVLRRHRGICSTCLLLQYLQLQNPGATLLPKSYGERLEIPLQKKKKRNNKNKKEIPLHFRDRKQIIEVGEFRGGLVVRTWHFHCQGPGSVPGRGTKILQVVWHATPPHPYTQKNRSGVAGGREGEKMETA